MNQRDNTHLAQNGEDYILEQIFLGRNAGYCVEVGAFDGLKMSNSFHLESIGWACLLVEANPELAAQCRRNRPKSLTINSAVVAPGMPGILKFQVAEENPGMSTIKIDTHNRRRLHGAYGSVRVREISVPAQTLDAILDEAKWPRVDFLSIDVEGSESQVLAGFNLRKWQPRVILVEQISAFPSWPLLRRFDAHGYQMTRRTGDNDWFQYVGDSQGAVSLILRHFVATSPKVLPGFIAAGLKNAAYKLGIYARLKSIYARLKKGGETR